MHKPTFLQFVAESSKWRALSTPEVDRYRGDLLDIVRNAYRPTELGPHIKNSNQLASSNWIVKFSSEFREDIEAAIFWRGPRANETWIGRKVQGIGHDGEPHSKHAVIARLVQELRTPDTWIEASGAVAKRLSAHMRPVTDQSVIQRLFQDDSIVVGADGRYTRSINGAMMSEMVFGNPSLKMEGRAHGA